MKNSQYNVSELFKTNEEFENNVYIENITEKLIDTEILQKNENRIFNDIENLKDIGHTLLDLINISIKSKDNLIKTLNGKYVKIYKKYQDMYLNLLIIIKDKTIIKNRNIYDRIKHMSSSEIDTIIRYIHLHSNLIGKIRILLNEKDKTVRVLFVIQLNN